MEELLLALDFGGTKHTVGVTRRGETYWRAHERVFSPIGADADYDRMTVVELARRLLNGHEPKAVGVSFGGPVDSTTGTVRLSHHVPGWENVPLRGILEKEFGAPASVDNDANVAALGEHRYGQGIGCDNLLYITISTGVGGGWILEGKVWHGWEGMAGEFGHMVVDPSGPLCLCGKRGCVERLASGPYIAQRAREWLDARPEEGQILRDLAGGNLMAVTAQLVSQAAAEGDGLAWEALQVSAWALGRGIGNTANLMNPHLFILGGGVSKSGAKFWELIRQVSRETALPEVHFEIKPAGLEDDAPLWGAVALAEECLRERGSGKHE